MVKMGKALSPWVGDMASERVLLDSSVLRRKTLRLQETAPGAPETTHHIHVTFVTVCCYNHYVLPLVIVVNHVLCLIYHLNLIIGIYVEEEKRAYRLQYCPWFQVSTRCLGTCPLQIRGALYFCFIFLSVSFSFRRSRVVGTPLCRHEWK